MLKRLLIILILILMLTPQVTLADSDQDVLASFLMAVCIVVTQNPDGSDNKDRAQECFAEAITQIKPIAY
jgi:hypothetical protein